MLNVASTSNIFLRETIKPHINALTFTMWEFTMCLLNHKSLNQTDLLFGVVSVHLCTRSSPAAFLNHSMQAHVKFTGRQIHSQMLSLRTPQYRSLLTVWSCGTHVKTLLVLLLTHKGWDSLTNMLHLRFKVKTITTFLPNIHPSQNRSSLELICPKMTFEMESPNLKIPPLLF